jgi:hypothetical protein
MTKKSLTETNPYHEADSAYEKVIKGNVYVDILWFVLALLSLSMSMWIVVLLASEV